MQPAKDTARIKKAKIFRVPRMSCLPLIVA
jgi:hypothetical protein